MCILVGCGDGKQDGFALLPEQENSTNDRQDKAEQVEPEDMKDKDAEETLDKSAEASDTSTDESTELCVFVESIGDNSVVGNKISMDPDIDGNNIVVMVGAGGDNKKLVSIYFADDTSYVYQIIRNGDVETREGSFSDIGVNMILDLTGYYKGEDFYADKAAISDVRNN